jgi:hypothetical protein
VTRGEFLNHLGRPTIWQGDREDAELVILRFRKDEIDFGGRQTPGEARVGIGLRDFGCVAPEQSGIFAEAYLRAEDVHMLAVT